nr:enteropeptidase isoform X1 [Paramormyrops kingsleyae]
MARGRRALSFTEASLSVLFLAELLVCVGLVIVGWLALHTDETQSHLDRSSTVLRGEFTIVNSTGFTEELRNTSSVPFKALAFDVEHLVSELYAGSLLAEQFRACVVQHFRSENRIRSYSRRSVVVTFDLLFYGIVGSEDAQEQLVRRVQATEGGGPGGLRIDGGSIRVTGEKWPPTGHPLTTTAQASPTAHLPTTTGKLDAVTLQCPADHMTCSDGSHCVPRVQFCDGADDCPDGSDENANLCATVCDKQFLLLGQTGSFQSQNFPLPYDNSITCRWIIRVLEGLVIAINFPSFETEEDIDVLKLYEGTGETKKLTYTLSGHSPGEVWLLSHEVTAEFSSNFINSLGGFKAVYRAANITDLSTDEDIASCSFEAGLCFWRQDSGEEGGWLRVNGPTFPPLTGPSFDHTLGNQSGYYIVTPRSPVPWEKNFRIHSLPLDHDSEPACLSFWYHMFGEDVQRLSVLLYWPNGTTMTFEREGNYADAWHYGQATLYDTAELTVVFEAQKRGGLTNDIALDDITLSRGPCVDGIYPEPTRVPIPTTPPSLPSDCGGPFDLWEPNSTFSSPNYPKSYSNKLSCVWTLHTEEGKNIQLHFLDFDVEATFDMVEIRDGEGMESTLLGIFTGSSASFVDLFSTTNHMTVLFLTDKSGYGRGFQANFTSGFGLGLPEPCVNGYFQCSSGSCVSNISVCDGQPDCPDASDEAECVHLLPVNGNSTGLLQLQVQGSWYMVCSRYWNPELSSFVCSYLGFRNGNASMLLVPEGNSTSFITLYETQNGTLDLIPSDSCTEQKVMSLECDNSPCGTKMVSLKAGGRATSERFPEEAVRIVGGTDAPVGAWPWAGSLHWRGRHACGASLIGREWLITAAHCVYGKHLHLSSWSVYLGVHSQSDISSPTVQERQIDRIVFNMHYNKRTKDSDIAMIHLDTQVNFTDFIQPICLPDQEQQFEEGRKCIITGWGRESEQGAVADTLQQASVPLVGRTECQTLLPEYNITARMVCAGFPQGGTDSCQGDSGGPLMCHSGHSWILVGVTSFGIGCGQPKRPGVYTLVSQFADWVAETRRSGMRENAFL